MSGVEDKFIFQSPTEDAIARLEDGDCKNTSEVICRIRNFKHVAKLGEELKKQIDKGDTRIVFSSVGYQDSQKKAVFAIGCYLADVIPDKKVLLITSGKSGDAFNFFKASEQSKAIDNCSVYRFGKNISIIDLEDFVGFGDEREKTLEYLLSAVQAHDIVLWNSPDVQIMRQYLQTYHRILQVFQILTLIVGSSELTTKNVEEIKDFFESHGISLRGAIFSPMTK